MRLSRATPGLLALAFAAAGALAQEPSPAAEPVVVAPPADAPHYRGYPEQDVLAYAVELHAEPLTGVCEGTVRIRILASAPLDVVRLDLEAADTWQVGLLEPVGPGVTATASDHQIVVSLGRTVPVGEEVVVALVFAGIPGDGLYAAENRYGDAGFLFTDHFTTKARGWLPCEDYVGDRAMWSLTLDLPAGTRALGAGEWRADESPPEGRAIWRGSTHSDLPPTLFAFCAGPYEEVVEKGDGRLHPHLVYPRDRARAADGLKYHTAWMQLMEETFGLYPYAKYATAQVPTRWGGVEYPGNVFLAESIFDGGDRGRRTLAHEFAHMWFGDGVGYADWQDAWLSEGFASYFGPWLSEQSGGLPIASTMKLKRAQWARARRAHEAPIRNAEWTVPDDLFGRWSANTYAKGAWVLHMLRSELGDEAFFGGLEAWYRERRGTATSSDTLRAALEQASGRDLTAFFAQWLDRPGAPVLRASLDGGRLLVEQVQEGVPFAFPLRVRWKDAEGRVQERVLQVDAARLEAELGEGASGLVLDPDTELLYLEAR